MEAPKKQKWKEMKRGKKKTFCKLYMCFRAATLDGVSMEIGHIEEDDTKGSNSKFSSPSEGEMRKKPCKRSLSSLLKVVMFGASLAKKMNRRELLQKKCRSNGSSSKNSQDHHLSPANTCSPTTPSTSRSSRDSSSLSSSTFNASTTPSTTAYPSSLGPKAKQDPYGNLETGIGLHGSNVGLGLVLLILLFVVVWGKTCAILCTAGCLFLVPKRSHSPEDGVGWRGGDDSEEHKKRVIMGGILGRCKN